MENLLKNQFVVTRKSCKLVTFILGKLWTTVLWHGNSYGAAGLQFWNNLLSYKTSAMESSNSDRKHFCSGLTNHDTSWLLAYFHFCNALTLLHTYPDICLRGCITCWMFCCEGGNDYGYYGMQPAYVGAVPFLGTVYFDASVVSYLRQQMYAMMLACFLRWLHRHHFHHHHRHHLKLWLTASRIGLVVTCPTADLGIKFCCGSFVCLSQKTALIMHCTPFLLLGLSIFFFCPSLPFLTE